MNWNYLKTNWFYLAMCVLLLVYAMRKYPQLFLFHSKHPATGIEKITKGKNEREAGAALLGFAPETPKVRPAEMTETDADQAEAFLKRFAQVAITERKKFGVPTSIILASAYVNSQAGKSAAAVDAHNFFALPCGQDWEGDSAKMDGNCMRKYESAWASFRDFSIYLSSQDWYGSLKKSAGKDWRKWVEKLGKEGVSNAKAMQKVIELYRLEELDGV